MVVSSTASWLALRACSMKSGAAHMSSVRPSSPPSMQAKMFSPSGAATSSTIAPPGAIRAQRAPTSSADQMCSSASSPQPSGPKRSLPSVSSKVVNSGVSAICAQMRRSVSDPSSAIVNAV